jgi:hypothetical protein
MAGVKIGYRGARSIPKEPNGTVYTLYRFFGLIKGIVKYEAIARRDGYVYLVDGSVIRDIDLTRSLETAERKQKRAREKQKVRRRRCQKEMK